MTLHSNNYYIMLENNSGYECIISYDNLEEAKKNAEIVTSELNKTCLIVKPVAKVIPNVEWTIKDL